MLKLILAWIYFNEMTVLNFGIWSIKYHPCYDDFCVKSLHIKKWERDISLKPSTRSGSVRMSKEAGRVGKKNG